MWTLQSGVSLDDRELGVALKW